MPSGFRVLAALLAGLSAGTAIAWAGDPRLLAIGSMLEPVGAIWIRALRATAVPLVVSLLISRIGANTVTSSGRITVRTITLFAVFAVSSALFAAATAPFLVDRMWLGAPILPSTSAGAPGATSAVPSLREWFMSLVPSNVVKAAADDAMLPLVLFVGAFAAALARVNPERRDAIIGLCAAITETMFVLVRWVLVFAPLGAFALSLSLAARSGGDLGPALAQLIVMECGLLVLLTLGLYPTAALIGGLPPGHFATTCVAAQAVALSTRSSLASLPAMLDVADSKLGLPPTVTGVVLPAAVCVFKFASPVVLTSGLLFVARLYGIQVTAPQIVIMALTVAALSFAAPGIPNGGLLVVAPVFTAFGLPLEGLGLLLSVSVLPDMFATVANVTADLTVAAILSARPHPENAAFASARSVRHEPGGSAPVLHVPAGPSRMTQ
jgi:proton glutamate symport protein